MSCTWLNPIAAPFALLLMALYRIFQGSPDNASTFAYALALIFVAIIVRVVLLPFQMKSKRGMLKQTRLQPKIAEIQKRHGANKQKLNEEMAKLYKEEGVNPASGCLWSFIQMPIMFALFYAIRQPITLMMRLGDDLWEGGVVGSAFNKSGQIYNKLAEILTPERFDQLFNSDRIDFYAELYIAQEISDHWEIFKNLGMEGLHRISFYLWNMNLAEVPNWQFFWSPDTVWADGAWVPGFFLFLLPIISGGAQFISAHITRKSTPQASPEASKGGAAAMMKFMPLMSVWFGFILPAALSIYWTIGTILQVAQDLWLNKRYTKILDEEDAEREATRKEKEADIEAKRLETERLKAEGLIAENKNTSKRRKQKTEKQERREKAAEWERKKSPKQSQSKDEPGRVGERRYARGRAYDPDRYKNAGAAATDNAALTDELPGRDDEYMQSDASGSFYETGNPQDIIESTGELVEDDETPGGEYDDDEQQDDDENQKDDNDD